MLDKLTHQAFQAWLNQKFQIMHSGGTLEVELISCRTLASPRRPDAPREPFSIIFRGPREPVLPQRSYPFAGGPADALEIFIVPIGPDAVGMRYEAIFT
jgi:hypothetical protein